MSGLIGSCGSVVLGMRDLRCQGSSVVEQGTHNTKGLFSLVSSHVLRGHQTTQDSALHPDCSFSHVILNRRIFPRGVTSKSDNFSAITPRRNTRTAAAPVFLSTLFPHPKYCRRWIVLGCTRWTPLLPLAPTAAPAAFRRCRPTASNAVRIEAHTMDET